MRKLVPIVVASAWAFACSQVAPHNGDWPVYGHDAGGTRYSPLQQINTSNVRRLQRAWVYHTGESGRSPAATPILVKDTLYFSTQNETVVAVDPLTGKEIWKITNPNPRGSESRGVAYWPGDSRTSPRILFGTGNGQLIA